MTVLIMMVEEMRKKQSQELMNVIEINDKDGADAKNEGVYSKDEVKHSEMSGLLF